jgi:hypothetical protein
VIDLPTKFRVYTEGRASKYYTVFVFADKRAMRIYQNAQSDIWGVKRWTKFEAICTGWKIKDRKRWRNIGCVLFHLDYIGSGVVSHEMTHAAIFWRKKRHSDERFCKVQGNLVRQFWWNYYRRGLDKQTKIINV